MQQVCGNPEVPKLALLDLHMYVYQIQLILVLHWCSMVPPASCAQKSLAFMTGRKSLVSYVTWTPGQLLVFILLLVDFFLGRKVFSARPIFIISHCWIKLTFVFHFLVYFCWVEGVQNSVSSDCLLISKYYFNLNTTVYFPVIFTNHLIFQPLVHFFKPQSEIVFNSSCNNGLWLFWEAVTVDEFFSSS